MLNHGFYLNLRELKEVAIPMINLLNGSNDIYYNLEDENIQGNLDDFISVKRYFSSGNNDIIVQSKAIICDNLLIISQLEIDGKAQIFLSRFKSDLDMILLQKQINAANPTANKKKEDNEKKKEAKSAKSKSFLSSIKLGFGKVEKKETEKNSLKQFQN